MEYSEPEEIAGSMGSINVQQINNLQVTPSEDAKSCTDRDERLVVKEDIFSQAKQTELDNWKRNDVFKEEKDKGQKCISTRWVCTLKETPVGIVPKAGLVEYVKNFNRLNHDGGINTFKLR